MKLLPVVFEEREIRRVYDEKTETWFFSVVDITQVLTQQSDYQASRKYWKVLKGRLAKEGSELVTNCYQFKFGQLPSARRAMFIERETSGARPPSGGPCSLELSILQTDMALLAEGIIGSASGL